MIIWLWNSLYRDNTEVLKNWPKTKSPRLTVCTYCKGNLIYQQRVLASESFMSFNLIDCLIDTIDWLFDCLFCFLWFVSQVKYIAVGRAVSPTKPSGLQSCYRWYCTIAAWLINLFVWLNTCNTLTVTAEKQAKRCYWYRTYNVIGSLTDWSILIGIIDWILVCLIYLWYTQSWSTYCRLQREVLLRQPRRRATDTLVDWLIDLSIEDKPDWRSINNNAWRTRNI